MYDQANGDDFFDRLPQVPVAIFAGAEDPVTNYGEGAREVARRLEEKGHDVELHIYPDVRHEVHNEPETRAEMENSLIEFVHRAAGRDDA